MKTFPIQSHHSFMTYISFIYKLNHLHILIIIIIIHPHRSSASETVGTLPRSLALMIPLLLTGWDEYFACEGDALHLIKGLNIITAREWLLKCVIHPVCL